MKRTVTLFTLSLITSTAGAAASTTVSDEYKSDILEAVAVDGLRCGEAAGRVERMDAGWECTLDYDDAMGRIPMSCLEALDAACADVGGLDEDSDGWTIDDGDCDDDDSATNPDASEICDGVDNDCSGYADDGLVQRYYLDEDGDGFGQPGTAVLTCDPADEYAPLGGDCDDADSAVNPWAVDTCWADMNCDASIDFGMHVPADYATVQDALDAADDGDHICLAAGGYYEAISISAGVTLEGEGPDVVSIEGTALTSTIEIDSNVTGLTLRGFTVTGGNATYGAGINGNSNVEATLEDLIVEDNSCDNEGGNCEGVGLSFFRSELTLRDVVVRSNTATSEYSWGTAIQIPWSTATLENVSVLDNVGDVETYAYGMISTYDSDITLTNVVIAGNTLFAADGEATLNGAALSCYGSSDCALENVTIYGNELDAGTGWANGTIYANSSDTLTATNVTVTDTVAAGDGRAVGGWYVNDSSAELEYCNTYNNGTDWGDDISDPTGINSNISATPDFADVSSSDPLDWDLTLAEGSALIDAGDASIFDADGSISDIGAYGGPSGAW